MRGLFVATAVALLAALPAAAESKEPVTVEIDAELLRRAKSLNMDLGAFLEKHLATALGADLPANGASGGKSHRDVLAAAMDSLEAVNLAPLQIVPSMTPDKIKALCQSARASRDELLASAELRRTMPLPEKLDEARALDQYRAERLQKIKAHIDKQGRAIRANAKVMERHCPDLKGDDPAFKAAFRTVVAPYGPKGWCQAMKRKPRAAWSMDDGHLFARFCTGG